MWIQSKSSDVELHESDTAKAKAILEKLAASQNFFPFWVGAKLL